MTDLTTLLLALPVFLALYNGVGTLLDSQKPKASWGGRKQRSGSAGKSLLEFSTLVGQLGFNQALLRSRRFRERLELLLVRSGHPFGWKPEDTLFYKEFLLSVAALLVWFSGSREIFVWGLALVVGFWMPDFYLQMQGATRHADLQRQLPGFVDLLALAVESGLDMMVSVERILDKMKPTALREELQTMLQESRLGSSRKDLLQRWAYRMGLSDAQSMASLIIQSEEMGTPLAAVLRSYTEDMRSRRILRAEELAGKIPVKILFPMMVFFFPIVFVIILGPVALDYIKNSQ